MAINNYEHGEEIFQSKTHSEIGLSIFTPTPSNADTVNIEIYNQKWIETKNETD